MSHKKPISIDEYRRRPIIDMEISQMLDEFDDDFPEQDVWEIAHRKYAGYFREHDDARSSDDWPRL